MIGCVFPRLTPQVCLQSCEAHVVCSVSAMLREKKRNKKTEKEQTGSLPATFEQRRLMRLSFAPTAVEHNTHTYIRTNVPSRRFAHCTPTSTQRIGPASCTTDEQQSILELLDINDMTTRPNALHPKKGNTRSNHSSSSSIRSSSRSMRAAAAVERQISSERHTCCAVG